ncbi:tetratricopeptide repeat protein [Kroppenstedtia pulmonis]|uniref:Tetratricopeptide repeat protein n=1 Tax=Kroppenstedtia pulmonis TaxID=1380685 RepID=A0A7D4CFK1_9BACL|nr:tetratricopeptide repeat protein [Kroppenstedtia pulmonis]QKG84374.1 tetratricopeptide repeat protein [Kroppenstedtia pulmonis]
MTTILQQWLKDTQDFLSKIEYDYPKAVASEREELRIQFQQIRKACESILEGWAVLEEQLAHLLKEHPDLAAEEEEVGEEFWLDSQVVRHFREGQGYYQLKMFYDAKPYFEKVVLKEPEFSLGRVYLALSDFHNRQWDQAFHQFKIVADTAEHPRFRGFAQHMMGCIEVQNKNDAKAIRHFKASLSMDEENSDSWFNLGACFYRLEEYSEAVPHFYRALQLDQDDWEAMYYLSCCFEKVHQWESVSYWRTAAYEKTKHTDLMETIARDYDLSGNSRQALHWYFKLLTRDPQHPIAYQGISWNLWQEGMQQEALLWIQKGLSLAPADPELLFTFVWYHLQQGSLKKVEQIFQRLPHHIKQDPFWKVLHSRMSMAMGNHEEAVEAAEKVIQHHSPVGRSLGHFQMGRLLLEQEKPVEAIPYFQQAQKASKEWKEPFFFEGLCHLINGDAATAQKCWSQISLVFSP